MPIVQTDLTQAFGRVVQRSSYASNVRRTAFLCHSHHDRLLAMGLQHLLYEQGLDLYIDWQDSTMPERPNAETAERLRMRIVDTTWFLFLATSNSMTSRWCPWELGFADGKKALERIAIVPTRDGATTHGNEYLELYRRIEPSAAGELAIFYPGAQTGAYVKSL